MSDSQYIQNTKDWISRFVIGLNLCPYAKVPFDQDRIRYSMSEESDIVAITNLILEEAQILLSLSPNEVETALILFPQLELQFEDFYEFHLVVTDFFIENDLDELLQLVVFHPQFRYEGMANDHVSNYTNRSPYPMLHLLRQQSVTEVANQSDGIKIAENNKELLSNMGKTAIEELLK